MIRASRKRLGISAQDLAERAGVARNTIIGLETGKRATHPAICEAIERALRELEQG
jgi:transcriptional regulator with XRE-family HTH domain